MASSRLSAAPVTKATRPSAPGASRRGRRRLNTGSSTGPVVPERGPSGSSAAGFAGVRPRPRNRARSVSYSTAAHRCRGVNGPDGFLLGGTRAPAAEQCAGRADIFGLEEQLGERRVGLVRAAVVEAHLGVTGDVEVARPLAVVDDRNHPDFRVVVRRSANRQARLGGRRHGAGNRPAKGGTSTSYSSAARQSG